MSNVDIISLGGVGGCNITDALKTLNYLTFPYSWVVSSQSFVINSFNNYNNFFDFDTKYLHSNHTSVLHTPTKSAVMLHDFNNLHNTIEKDNTIEKYKRRFERLNNTLLNTNKLILIRLPDNLKSPMLPYGLYDNIYIREEEDISKWNDFFIDICNTYPKKEIHLLIITDILSKVINRPLNMHRNMHLIYNQNHKDKNVLINILNKMLETIK